MTRLKLGVLDQSPISSGASPREALENTLDLARQTDKLGFTRFWLAEHHGSNSFAGSSPELLISRIAAETQTMKIGSGGVMLPHYSPYKVAENFRLLETLHPNRIDLGIGRAPGSDLLTSQALAYGSQIGIEYFPNKVADLKAFVAGKPAITKGLEKAEATPRAETIPEMWMLGSSQQSAIYAAHFEMPYSFAHFIAPDQSLGCVQEYFKLCKASGVKPKANLGVFVLCADNAQKVEELAACRDLWRLRFEKGDPGPCPSIAEALDFKYTQEEKDRLASRRKHLITGEAEEVKRSLQALADEHGVDELVVVTICHQHQDRLRSYELLSEAFRLKQF